MRYTMRYEPRTSSRTAGRPSSGTMRPDSG
jgi:hypothetical protein